MAEKFEVGAVVQLKSGGPAMTVSSIEESGRYRCVWFKGASREAANFEGHTLKPYAPPSKP